LSTRGGPDEAALTKEAEKPICPRPAFAGRDCPWEEAMFHRWVRLRSAVQFAAAAILCAGFTYTESLAGDSGKWRGRAVLVVIASKEVKVADRSDHSVSLTEYDGVVFSEGEKPFLANARYQVVDLYDAGGLVGGGYKTFTADDGSQIFAQYEGTGGAPPVFTGKWKFVAGSGKYKGITGAGTYEFHNVSETTAWDVLEGDYKLP
jgi:hypothetical protein